jgi:hypothetical protein
MTNLKRNEILLDHFMSALIPCLPMGTLIAIFKLYSFISNLIRRKFPDLENFFDYWKIPGCSGPLSRDGSLTCRTYCDTGPLFYRSHPKDCPIQSPLTTLKGMLRTYSNSDPYGLQVIDIKISIGEVSNLLNVKKAYTLYKVECRATRIHNKAKVGPGAMEE